MQKIAIELTADEWDDLTEAVYCYAAEMKYQYGEYLQKGRAKQGLGDFVRRTEVLAERIDKEVKSNLKAGKQDDSNN